MRTASGRRPGWGHALVLGRYFAGLALAAIAFVVVFGRRGELAGAASYLDRLAWPWLLPAAACEVVSAIAFARLQGGLLFAGGVPTRTGRMLAVTLASNSIANSLPGGVAFASVFAYRQYRHVGASDALSAWTLLATGGLATSTLAILASVGTAVAGPSGATLDISATVLGCLVVACLATLLLVRRGSIAALLEKGERLYWRVRGRARSPSGALSGFGTRLVAIRPSGTSLGGASLWALANWVFDCACLAISFVAVGAPVPWRGLAFAYGIGQLAAILPITPGGLGVVEGSLTIALVAYGGSTASTVAAVFLYRLLSFWVQLPIGWTLWGALALARRRTRSPEPEAIST